MKAKFLHNNFNVLDLDKSLAFYKEALGLTEKRRLETPGFILVYLTDGQTSHELELTYFRNYLIQRAENGTQTRDPQLGRLVLYRLSYFRRLLFIRQLQKILFSLFRLVDVSVDVCVKPDRVYILS